MSIVGKKAAALTVALMVAGGALAAADSAAAAPARRAHSPHVSVVPSKHLTVGQKVRVKYHDLKHSGIANSVGRPYYVKGAKYIAAECGYFNTSSLGCTHMKGKAITLTGSGSGSIKMTLVRGSGPNCEKYKCSVAFISTKKDWYSSSLPLGFSAAMPKLAAPNKH